MTSAVHDYQYSVQVKSRFDLLGSDDFNNEDPEILLKKMKTQRSEAKASKEVVVPKAAASEKHSESGNRDRRGGQRDDAAAVPRTESWEARGRGNRGRGGFTRNRPVRAGGAQREFDRHSGSDKTGVKAVMKKDGHGTGNWGTMEDELEAQTAELNLEAPVEEETPAEVAAEAEPVEEEPKTLTLKEYREQLKASKAKVQLTTKGSRRANEGKNVFSNMVEVHKSKPVENKVEVVFDEEKSSEASKPVFFELSRGRSQPRGRGGPRPSGLGESRGRGGGPRFERHEHDNAEESTGAPDAVAPSEDRPARGGRGGERGSRGGERGARGERGSRGGRGRGAPRGSFSHERGAHRGSFNPERGAHRGSFNPERGGGRGGAAGDRPSFRGGERGSRGSRGGPRGGFRGGRGGSEQHVAEHRPASSRSAAPVMDSDLDFPALK